MKKSLFFALAVLTVTGTAIASHGPPQKPGGKDAHTMTTGPGQGQGTAPNTTGKPNKTGPANQMNGISTAITTAPQRVADTVLKPIQNVDPGKTLGNVLSRLNPGMFLEDSNATDNETRNQTQ